MKAYLRSSLIALLLFTFSFSAQAQKSSNQTTIIDFAKTNGFAEALNIEDSYIDEVLARLFKSQNHTVSFKATSVTTDKLKNDIYTFELYLDNYKVEHSNIKVILKDAQIKKVIHNISNVSNLKFQPAKISSKAGFQIAKNAFKNSYGKIKTKPNA
ncbi:hypothetical protein Q2T40_09250 [Winogradskyella maritima]|uniref:Uncharacterized protein n=1 Tax=Winogradskyella maritima TaxID=1517766 RepID=A0ABV8AJY9_9FLAO|nr:hypothetical protein [Winogradskyella maritima]